jgi:hypothetical protein
MTEKELNKKLNILYEGLKRSYRNYCTKQTKTLLKVLKGEMLVYKEQFNTFNLSFYKK